MDYRVPLKFHTVLAFEGICCHVEDVVGRGSNAIVYKGWYEDGLNPQLCHHVLIKELFPLHPQGKIRRDHSGAIIVEPEAEELWKTHRESFEAGNTVHLRLLEDHPELLGANLNSYRHNGTLYTLLGYSGGRSLQAELSREKQSLREAVLRMIRILDALEAFHKSGYLHLDISPDNIMLVGQGEQERAFLIDYNSARELGSRDVGYLSCKAGFSAPEVETGELEAIGLASDIYSVTAVFFRNLMGRNLSISEMLRPKAPDGRESPLLADVPESVSAMAAQILRKGLNTLPSRRYQTTGQMRRAFQELLDRIDCIGVTHWALWEHGKRAVEDLIRMNPSFAYLKQTAELYPIRLEGEDMTLQRYLDGVLSPEGRSGLILARGGMGKTTLLLHTALTRGKRYSPASPAVFYISLHGWDGSDSGFIRRQILLRLRFRTEENTFDSAMHALHQLLNRGLQTKAGNAPAVLLLLDGLNEIHGDKTLLIQEIRHLASMAGVRILAASRSNIPELEFSVLGLQKLTGEDIEEALGRRGLLVPRIAEMQSLLTTPLMLSIFMQAGSGDKQLDISSEEELMHAYLEALLEKELRELPEGSPRRWQVDAALKLVLPAIAAKTRRSGHGLTEQQLLEVVESCWKLLQSRVMKNVFPRWIGHSRDIMGTARTADEWFGQMVHDLLWQRLGMLMKDSEGRTRVYHQQIEGFLVGLDDTTSGKIRKCRIRDGSIAAEMVIALVLVLALILGPRIQRKLEENRVTYYDTARTETVIDQVSVCYSTYGSSLLRMQKLLAYLEEGNTVDFLLWYDRWAPAFSEPSLMTEQAEKYLSQIDELCLSGDQVEWSGLPFAGDAAKLLITDAVGRQELYREYLPLLQFWAQSERARRFCPDFPEIWEALMEADIRVMSKLYYSSCYPHLNGAEEVWAAAVRDLLAPVPGYESEPEENLESLQKRQRTLEEEFTAAAATLGQLYRAETE